VILYPRQGKWFTLTKVVGTLIELREFWAVKPSKQKGEWEGAAGRLGSAEVNLE
jgi:hypothetical protein